MEFRVLGPLVASDRDAPVSLGGPQQQTVFAVLLAHANTVVSTDRLIDEVWGESPPDTARKAVQSYVALLRKAVNVEEEALRSGARGYVLELKPDQVDSLRFEELLDEGRSLLRSDPAEAAGLLREGLGLWRGSPFAGLAEEAPSLREETARLEGLRLTGLEDRIEADLVAGNIGGLAAELEQLATEHPYRERLWALQILVLYRSARQTEALRAYEQLRMTLAEELGLDPSPELQRLEQRILEQDPLLESADPLAAFALPEQTADRRNPYKGLRPFEEADSADFFGRKDLVSRLVERLRRRDASGRVVVLVGPSGSGKSSVVKAGLIPQIRAGAVPGSDSWQIVQVFPGPNPFDQLAAALAATAGTDRDQIRDLLQRPDAAHGLAELTDETGPLLVVVDQFEELFTLVPDPKIRGHFLNWLVAAAEDEAGRVRAVLTLRADFVDRPLHHPRFATTMEQALVLVPPLDEYEVRDAIVEPSGRVGVRVEPELVAAMIRDAAARPSTLPLLQYALTDLFERRGGDTLTADAYRAAGSIVGALGRRGDGLYLESSETEQATTRQLFLRLVTLTDDAEQLRRRVTRTELADLPGDPAPLDQVLGRYGQQRLLTFDRDSNTGEATVEVAHEALLREWPRLRDWIDTSRDDLRLHRRLTSAAGDWNDAGQDPSYLIGGSRLAQYERLATSPEFALTRTEMDFIAGSRDKATAEEQQRRRRRRTLMGVFAGATVIALALASFAFTQRERARQNEQLARIREFAAAAVDELDNDPQRGLLLALTASEMSLESSGDLLREAEEALRRAILESRLELIITSGEDIGGVDSVAAVFDPTGRRLAVGSSDGVVRIFDPESGALLSRLEGHAGSVVDVKWSKDGARLLTVSVDGTARLWEVAGGTVNQVFGSVARGMLIGSFSPDESRIVTTAFDGSVRVWDTASGDEVLRIDIQPSPPLQPVGVAFEPVTGDRIAVAVAGPGELRAGVFVFDAETGDEEVAISMDDGACELRWSPDGTKLATASADATGRVWDAATGAEIARFNDHHSFLCTVDFSPDGSLVATGGDDGTTRIWEASTGKPVIRLEGHDERLGFVSFSPDGARLASSSGDGTIRIWDVRPEGRREVIAVTDPTVIFEARYSPDGNRFVTASDSGVARVWDSRTGRLITELVGHDHWVYAAAFTPDGSRVVTGSRDLTVRIWDASTGEQIAAREVPFPAVGVAMSPDGSTVAIGTEASFHLWNFATDEFRSSESEVRSFGVAFSPDGSRVAAGRTMDILVFDVASFEASEPIEFPQRGYSEEVLSVSFTADGTRLLSAHYDGTVRLWDLEQRREIIRYEGHNGLVWEAALSPNESIVATASFDGTVRVWDTTTAEEVLRFEDDQAFSSVSFSPDGRHLLVSGDFGARVHTLDIDELLDLARSRLLRWWTPEECFQFLSVETCPPPPLASG